jgi:hypothetical protein
MWTLQLATEVSFIQEFTPCPVSQETILIVLHRSRTAWKCAKHWMIIPDPGYA